MILFCRKNQPNRRFVFFGENGPDSHASTQAEMADKPKEKIEPKLQNSEDITKERDGLLARHNQVNQRIGNANNRYDRCKEIAENKLPAGSEAQKIALDACVKAKGKLDKIDREFPVADELSQDVIKHEEVINRADSITRKVVRDLTDTEKQELEAKKTVDSLSGFGLKTEAIQSIFQDNASNISDISFIIKDLQGLKSDGTDGDFRKIVDDINKIGNLEKFNSNLRELGNLKILSTQQKIGVMAMDKVLDGSLKVETVIKYLTDATTDKKFDVGFALSVIDTIKMDEDIGSQLEELKFYNDTTGSLKEQGLDAKIDVALMSSFVDFVRKTQDLAIPLDYKVELFKIENNPTEAIAIYHLAETSAVYNGQSVIDSVKTIKGFDANISKDDVIKGIMTLEKGCRPKFEEGLLGSKKVESKNSEQISDEMDEYAKKIDGYSDFKNDFKKIALLMKLYPNAKDASNGLGGNVEILIKGKSESIKISEASLFKGNMGEALLFISELKGKITPSEIVQRWEEGKRNPAEILELSRYTEDYKSMNYPDLPMSLELGRALGKVPGLYPFAAIVTGRTVVDKFGNDEFMAFLGDPGLMNAIKINEIFNGKIKGELTPDDVKSAEKYLNAGRALDLAGVKPEELKINDDKTISMLNSKFDELENHAKAHENEELYYYVENGVRKPRDVIFLASNESDHGDKQFYSKDLIASFLKQGIDFTDTTKPKALFATKDSSPTPEEADETKKDLIARLTSATPPLTFTFNGHSGSDGKVSGIYYDKNACLSEEELAGIIKTRSKNAKFSRELLAKDTYLLSGCDTRRVVTNVYKLVLQNKDIVIPRMGGASDYGFKVGIDGNHAKDTLQVNDSDAAKIGGLGNLNKTNHGRSTFMFARNKDNIPQQVVGP